MLAQLLRAAPGSELYGAGLCRAMGSKRHLLPVVGGDCLHGVFALANWEAS